MTTLNIDIDSQGIALLSIDLPDRSMNVITPELTSELDAAIDRIAGGDGIKGAIITSAKQGSFVAGADLKGMLASFDRGIDAVEAAGNSEELSVLFRRMETVRPDGEKSPGFIAHLEARIARGLARLESHCGEPHGEPLDAEEITRLCALDYVDFRHPHGWRDNHPKLAAWLAGVSERGTAQVSKPGRTDPVAAPL